MHPHMADGVHRFLVTSSDEARMAFWARTALYANWIEGRPNPRGETWLVTVFDEHAEQFLHAARFDHYAITVEEVQGAGDDERYLLRFGTPGTGWQG